MNSEIKRLLQLKSVPGFQLLEKEEAKLKAWKQEQKPVEIKKPRRTRARKGYTTMSGMGDDTQVAEVPTKTIKKRTNQVKKSEKEVGEIPEES